MAHVKAFVNGASGRFEIHAFKDFKSAKQAASSMMALEVTPFTTESGLVSDKPYSKVEVYDDDGKYITTAWGE